MDNCCKPGAEKPNKNGLSVSLTSHLDTIRRLGRADSSDSGGVSFYQDSRSGKSEKNSVVFTHRAYAIDTVDNRLESSSEQSDSYLEREDSLVGKKGAYGKKPNVMAHIVNDLLAHEQSSSRDLNLLSRKLFTRLQSTIENCRVVNELFRILSDLEESQKKFLLHLNQTVKSKDEKALEEVPSQMLCAAHNLIPIYSNLIQQYPIYISALDELAKSKPQFRNEFLKFESSDECYLPINWILLKLPHRILGWQPVSNYYPLISNVVYLFNFFKICKILQILARIVEHMLADGREESETTSARVAFEKISQFKDKSRQQREALNEFVALLQIEKDLGVQGILTHPYRRLIRFGWVERWSQKGLSARVLLLLSDRILFAHRSHQSDVAPFTIHAELKLKGMLFYSKLTFDEKENISASRDYYDNISEPQKASII
uniref:DH domain-containing protein n=1 Tax=Heterorhabditis bacteriophora TaxID=37862 RepID=A0A1I7XGM4_HETBA